MRTGLIAALLCGAAILTVSAASAAPLTLQNGFVQAGVSDYGTLGSDGATSPGILYDATGAGSYGNNDFLTPGDPFEGFYIKADGGYFSGNNNDGNGTFGASAVLTQIDATHASAILNDGTLSVAFNYALTTIAGRSVIDINTTLTNVLATGGALTGLQFLRVTDPDPDHNVFGVFETANSNVNPHESCATGNHSGETICISTTNTTLTSGTGVGPGSGCTIGGGWDCIPQDYLNHIFDNAFADDSIGIGFDLGDLGAGQSVSFENYYALGADLGTASGGPTSAPEPITLSLFGAGVGGAVAMRRRKAKKA